MLFSQCNVMNHEIIIDGLQEDLQDAKCHLDEVNECGDLEDRLEALQQVEDIERALFRARLGATGSM